MTTISARIIEDSISPQGVRLTTMQLRYPRFIHAESKTHRLLSETGEVIEEFLSPGVMNDPNLSRNARSSRAVPVAKMIQEVIDDPVIPLHWGAAQSGMQAYAECDDLVGIGWTDFEQKEDGKIVVTHPIHRMPREEAWLWARDQAVSAARAFHAAGYAKQLINRLLEPFLHIDTLVTASDWDNFFALRDHHAAEPHIRMLARAMKQAMTESVPNILLPGEWHMPYIDDDSISMMTRWLTVNGHRPLSQESLTALSCKMSAARCARISYAPFEGNISIEKDLHLAVSLIENGHMSPCEHQATPDYYISDKAMVKEWRHPELAGNLTGWIQFRKSLPGENAVGKAA